jgi:hypothetical protein
MPADASFTLQEFVKLQERTMQRKQVGPGLMSMTYIMHHITPPAQERGAQHGRLLPRCGPVPFILLRICERFRPHLPRTESHLRQDWGSARKTATWLQLTVRRRF